MPIQPRVPVPDGIVLEFTANCPSGHRGEVKKISYSFAKLLVERGYAKLYYPPAVSIVRPPQQPFHATAICPTYNRRKYLPAVIRCFFSQTATDSELVIVDDSEQPMRDIVPDDPRIQYIRLDTKHTIGAKRNIACEAARGKIILHFDDDDWSSCDRIAHQTEILKKRNAEVVSYYNILYLNELTGKLYRYNPQNMVAAHGATFCYTKAFWERCKFVDTNIGEDTNFGNTARTTKSIVWENATDHMVITAHGSNTCSTAQGMGNSHIPEVSLSELPRLFSTAPTALIAICSWVTGALRGDNQAIRDAFLRDVLKFPHMDYKFFVGDGTPTGEDEKALAASARFDCRHFSLQKPPQPATYEPQPDEVVLRVPDDYLHLTHKSRAVHRWALARSYEHIFLCYPDTFINIERLAACGYAAHDYFGRALNNTGVLYAKGGQGRWLSKRAAKIIADAPVTDWAEDRWVGRLMTAAGIKLAPDARFADYPLAPRRDNNVITSHLAESKAYDNKFMGELKKQFGTDDDLLLAVIRNYRWADVRPFVLSLRATGTKAKCVMFVDNVDAVTCAKLKQHDFEVLPFKTMNPQRFVTSERFLPAVEYLEKNASKHRFVIWADVRDVVFQSDPFAWLNAKLAPHKLLGCTECVKIKHDSTGYNGRWIRESFPDVAVQARLLEEEICCGGTVAGDAQTVTACLKKIYETCSVNPAANDQGVLNYLLRYDFGDVTRVPRMSEAFTVTLSWQCGRGFNENGKNLCEPPATFDAASASVLNADGVPFSIVHQHDREPAWFAAISQRWSHE